MDLFSSNSLNKLDSLPKLIINNIIFIISNIFILYTDYTIDKNHI